MDLGLARRRARMHSARRNHAAAIEVWRDVLSEDPMLAEGHAELAIALLATKRMRGAETEAREALRLDAQQPLALYALAATALIQNRQRKAFALIEELLALDPGYLPALVLKARALRFHGHHKQAAAAIAEALERAPGDPDVLIERAWQARHARDYETLESIARSILESDPENAEALVLIGYARLDHGERDEALAIALAALSADPTDSEALTLVVEVKVTRNPLAAIYWVMLRALAGLSNNKRWILSGAVYLAYLMTLSTFDWFDAPYAAKWCFIVIYLILSIGIIVTDRVILWQVQREQKQVRLARNF